MPLSLISFTCETCGEHVVMERDGLPVLTAEEARTSHAMVCKGGLIEE